MHSWFSHVPITGDEFDTVGPSSSHASIKEDMINRTAWALSGFKTPTTLINPFVIKLNTVSMALTARVGTGV